MNHNERAALIVLVGGLAVAAASSLCVQRARAEPPIPEVPREVSRALERVDLGVER